MSQRLTRKEIKHDIREDSFRHTVARGLEYMAANTRMLAAVLGGIVLLVIAVVAVRAHLERRAETASEMLGRALAVYQAPIQTTGARPDHPRNPSFADEDSRRQRATELFQELRDRYSRTGAAAVATVYLGRIELEQENTEAARELWREFLRRSDDHMLASAVRLSLFDLDRAAGQGEEVAGELRGMLAARRKPLPEDVVLFELARTLEQLGEQEEARSTYQRVGDEYPDSPYAQQALSRARELGPGVEVS